MFFLRNLRYVEEDIDVSPPEANLNIVSSFPLSFTVILETADRFRSHCMSVFDLSHSGAQ